MDRKDLDAFLNRMSSFGEHYSDFFVAVRTRDGELVWKSSDKTWALGICTRYVNHVNAADSLKLQTED